MAVLVEAVSVIVRRDTIERQCLDGWDDFVSGIPAESHCSDGELVCASFMSASVAESFISQLELRGLTFLRDGKVVDVAVATQMDGLQFPTAWLWFAHVPFPGTDNVVALCWPRRLDDEDRGIAVTVPASGYRVSTPKGWVYGKSLSKNFVRLQGGDIEQRLRFLRHEQGTDYYLDANTGKEVHRRRTHNSPPEHELPVDAPMASVSPTVVPKRAEAGIDSDVPSDETTRRWLVLRSIEWLNWPAFISQLFVPILLIFVPWFYLLIAILILGVVWTAVRYNFANIYLAESAAVIVAWLRWPFALGSAAYLFTHDRVGIGFVALLWPALAALVGIPGKIGVVEHAFKAVCTRRRKSEQEQEHR